MAAPIFAHGQMRLYLLTLLAESPMHGYELMQAIEQRFDGTYVPSAGTIYPRLAKLADDGLITKRTVGRKTVYEITDEGRAELDRRKPETDRLEDDIDSSVHRLADQLRSDVRSSMRSLKDDLDAECSSPSGADASWMPFDAGGRDARRERDGRTDPRDRSGWSDSADWRRSDQRGGSRAGFRDDSRGDSRGDAFGDAFDGAFGDAFDGAFGEGREGRAGDRGGDDAPDDDARQPGRGSVGTAERMIYRFGMDMRDTLRAADAAGTLSADAVRALDEDLRRTARHIRSLIAGR